MNDTTNQDTLWYTLSFCKRGSDFKSWILVCKLWCGFLHSIFPKPQFHFGNKLLTIIDLLKINSIVYSKSFIRNMYVPRTKAMDICKSEHDYKILSERLDTPQEETIKYNNFFNPGTLTSEEIECDIRKRCLLEHLLSRKFENQEEVVKVFEYFEHLIKEHKILFTTIHKSVYPKTLFENSSISEHVHWRSLPTTHTLTTEEWSILTKRFGLCGKSVNEAIDFYKSITNNQLAWYGTYWIQYLTTTPEMIIEFCRLRKITDEQMIGKMLSQCQNLTPQYIIDNPNVDWNYWELCDNPFGNSSLD